MGKPVKALRKYENLEVPDDNNNGSFETDLEEALDIAGFGKYQYLHCCLMVATLSAAVLEIIGNAFILPAAACDLALPDRLWGTITSVPNLGVILTAPVWGWAADSLGRKPVLLISCVASGGIGLIAAFSSSLVSYAACKFVASLFLSCPSSLGWAYIGEMVPRRRRDTILLICNGFLMLSSILSPVIAWGILSHEWRYFGTYVIRPWRLLTAVYSLPLVLVVFGVQCANESPKFLVSRGKRRQALDVLRRIYAVNSGIPAEKFCVTSLRDDSERMTTERGVGCVVAKWRGDSTLMLLRPPHLKWLALTGFLMFGLFALLNGLFLLAPDTINKALSSATEEGNMCVYIDEDQTSNYNQTAPSEPCSDTMSQSTFTIMVSSTLVYSAVVLLVSVSSLDKRTLLISMFAAVGVTCLMCSMQNNKMVAGVAMSSMMLTALGIGPLTAYAVHLFPTTLRYLWCCCKICIGAICIDKLAPLNIKLIKTGSAVGAVLMCGRLGAVVGANSAAYFLAVSCTHTFYTFSALLFLCAGLSFLLPSHDNSTCSRGDYIPIDER